MKELDKFTRAYIECALWASFNPADSSDCPESLDEQHSISDLPVELVATMRADCNAFRETYAELLKQLYNEHDVDDSQNGHDFWLTREGHGAGFWDRGYGDIGDKLSDAAETFGNGSDAFYLYDCWLEPATV